MQKEIEMSSQSQQSMDSTLDSMPDNETNDNSVDWPQSYSQSPNDSLNSTNDDIIESSQNDLFMDLFDPKVLKNVKTEPSDQLINNEKTENGLKIKFSFYSIIQTLIFCFFFLKPLKSQVRV
jgi:hypothetical protein